MGSITGTVTDASAVVELLAGFNDTPRQNFTNIIANRQEDGSFTLTSTILESIYGNSLPDGIHTLHLVAKDEYDNQSQTDYTFTLDTTPPEITNFTLHPKAETVTLVGQTEPNIDITLEQTDATVTSDSSGRFEFSDVSKSLLDNTVTIKANDIAGNSTTFNQTIKREECYFDNNLTGWTVTQTGGTGSVVADKCSAILTEGNSFDVTIKRTFEIPTNPSVLTFTYSNLNFDTAAVNQIKDAFEVALVDSEGRSLVHTIGKDKSAFFNITESLTPQLAPGVTINGQTVSLDLSGLNPGTAATLQLRLVNNDNDINTNVRITEVKIQSNDAGIPPVVIPDSPERIVNEPIDFNKLSDVSNSLTASYGQTSFNQDTKILRSNLTITNAGQYPVKEKLLVGVTNISDPTVRLKNASGKTPTGIAYIDYSKLLAQGKLLPGENTQTQTLEFANPNGVQFTYELVFLSQLNTEPEITSTPDIEAIVGKPYLYDVDATDADKDSLTYSLLSRPDGLSINSATGEITWNPTTADIGNHNVIVQVKDNFGGEATQQYVLSTINPPPNRPPLFTSIPVVDAKVNTPYKYEAKAKDDDGDNLTFSLLEAPLGMRVNPDTGVVTWVPDGNQLGKVDVKLKVEDGAGGVAEQIYQILTQIEPGNHAPFILSEPITIVNVPIGYVPSTSSSYTYNLRALDPDSDTLSYTLVTHPEGMTIDSHKGAINWNPTENALFSHQITVQVSDGRGGIETQSFKLDALPSYPGQIRGVVFHDINDDGQQYNSIGNSNSPVTVTGGGGSPITLTNDTTRLVVYGGLAGNGLIPSGGYYTQTDLARGITPTWSIDPVLRFPSGAVTVLSNNNVNGAFGAPEYIGNGVVRNTSIANGVKVQADTELLGSNPKTTFTLKANPGNSLDGTSFIFYAENDILGLSNVASYIGSIAGKDLALFQYDSYSQNFTVRLTGEAGPGAKLDLFGSGRWTGFGSALEAGSLDVLSADGSNFITTGDLGLALGFSLEGTEASVTINYDNQPTPPDPGLVRVLYLDDNQNGLRDSNEKFTTTDSNGNYAFNSLAPGNYTVVQEPLPGWILTAPTSEVYQVSVANSQIVGGINFGNLQQTGGNIKGFVFNDSNGDGIKQTNEKGLENWLIYLDNNSNGRRDSNERFTFTDSLGSYTFANLRAGTYKVATEIQPGFVQTAPTGSNYSVTVSAAQTQTDINFGNAIQQTEVNRPPLFEIDPATGTSNAPKNATVGQLMRYKASATDADGDSLTYSLSVKPDGMIVDPETGVLVWRATADQIGNHDVILKVADGKGGVDLLFFQIAVLSNNTLPTITSTPPLTAAVNRPYQYPIRVLDADGDSISFRLENAPNGMLVDEKGILTWTPTTNYLGTQQVNIIVSDGNGGEAKQTFNLNVLENAPNSDPIITSTPRNKIGFGNNYFYQVEVNNTDGDPLTYSLETHPIGMSIDSQGRVFWKPTAAQFGNNSIKIKVDDGRGGIDVQEFVVNVVSTTINAAPSIDSTPSLTATVNRSYEYNLTGSDPDNDPLLWSLDAAPPGMSIDPEKGVIRWTPTAQQVGEHEVAVRVMDSMGAYVGQIFTITVRGVNVAPTIISTPPTTAAVSKAYKYAVLAKDLENDSLKFSLLNSPSGMTINRDTGLIDWMPTNSQLGEQNVEVIVEDSLGETTKQSYKILVKQTAENLAPSITSTPSNVAAVGQVYEYAITATDPENEVLQYQLLDKPLGMTVDSVTGIVRWMPTEGGVYSVTVGAIDGSGAGAAQQFELNVAVNQIPQIVSTPVESITLGKTYRYDVKATDGNGDALVYSLTNPVAGMEIDSFGRISWSPVNTGDIPVVVTVTDSRGASVSQAYNLSVVADNTAPKVSLWSSRVGSVDKGELVSFVVSATDDVGVSATVLRVNNQVVPLDSQGRATVRMDTAGVVEAVAIATDVAGNSGSASNSINVVDSSDIDAPILEISSLEDEQIITAPIDIIGTVNDSNLSYYRLLVSTVDGGEFREVFRGTSPVTDGVLGKFDPSVLGNDSYVLRLEAADVGGNVSSVERVVNVAGELKLGNFRLSFTDLSIPVAGIPINVTRTYDSLNANSKDDFGYGWRLEFRDTDLRTSLKKDETFEQLGVRTVAFKDKTRVYITLPGGKREAFTFKPTGDRLNSYFSQPEAWIYHPSFVGDKGVTSKLSVVDTRLSRVGNEYFGLNGEPYNPADSAFGGKYVLTTKEGIVYEIDGISGDLLTATDTNGNKLTFTDGGIFNDSGKSVTFVRDAMGRIVSVTDLLGKQIRYQYDEKGDLVGVTDRENNTTQFVYNEPQRTHFLTEVIDPLLRTGVKNEYDEKGRLKKLFDASNNAVELIHDPDNFVETVKDVFGKATTYEYDSRGNVVTEIDPLGKVTKRTYDDDNNMLSETVITEETGINGWKTEFTYDNAGNKLTEKDPLGNITRYTYGAFGRLLTETDPLGNTTTNTYSRSGNLLSSVDAAGNVTSYSYDIKGNLLGFTDANKKVTQFKYDSFGNVQSVLDALNNETTYTYDANGNRKTETKKVTTPFGVQSIVTKWDYDNSGKVKFVTDAEDEVTEYQYDKNGNQIAVIDALLRKTESRYDDKGQLIETIYPDKTPNDNSDNPRTINLYDKGGRKRATIDQDGRVTHYKYDDAGRQIETIYPKETDTLTLLIEALAPSQTPATIDWTQVLYPDETPDYLATNPRSKTEYYKTGEVKAQIDELLNRTEYRYNAKGALIETIYPDNTPNILSDNPRTSSKYDSSGRLTDSIDPQGRITSYKYDSLSRQIETIYPDNTPNNLSDNPTTKTEYDKLGRKIASTDQNGKVTRYEYDDIGQLTDVVQILDASVEVRTEYGYDEANRLIWIEDANDYKTKYEYDKNGRRIATSLPLGKKSYTTYDAVGNIYTTTDFNGDSISYQYDEQNRLIKKEFSAASGQVPVTFTYTPSGQIDKIVDARGTTSFKYDERNRLISRTDPNGVYLASGNTIEYGYDGLGNRTSVRTPNGNVSYTYDEQNRLKTVTSSQGTTTYFYDVVGNLVKTELPNGVVETRDYDELNRLKLVKNSKDGVVISSFDYTLDLVGHRRVVQEQNGRKVEYEYDSLYRLTKETITDAVAGNRIIEYSYDKVGNRLTKNDSVEGITTYSYDDNDRLKTEELKKNNVVVQTIEYRYDDNGNQISQIKNGVEEVSYTWDKENRLIGVRKANGEVISYQYDSDGIRVSSTVNGVKTEYLVDKNRDYAQVLEERVNNGLVAGYVYGNDLISQQRGSEKSFYLVDGLGSTRGLTNASGGVTDRYSYDAFGNLIESGGNSENNYLFAGEQFDKSLGDYYLRQRFYDTDTGRFTRRDSYEGSIFNPISQHKYLYANANPVNFIDPSGLIAIPGSGELNVSFLILGILLTLISTALTSDTVQKDEDQGRRTFYRGTTFYDAHETVATQHIDIERIMLNQAQYGLIGERSGVYFTSQFSTAQYYANLVGGQGRGGGPGVNGAIVPVRQFDLFAAKYGIAVEVPVPNPPTPGQTETLIPFRAMPEFETFAEYIMF